MTNETRRLAQEQFGVNAAAYVTSPDHAIGGSLPRLVALTEPEPSWLGLDIATGGGHTALAFTPYCDHIIASDLTFQMLEAARQHIVEIQGADISFCQHDAEHLPFPAGRFDLVTCRIAPHHFPDTPAFVREVARVLKHGGRLAVADNIISGEPRVARFVNTFEKLRDPSHNWAYSSADWETFFASANLVLNHAETIEKRIDFDRWAARMAVSGPDRVRLKALLLQAPPEPQIWLQVEIIGSQVSFVLREGIFIARKP